jgi:hypothetical protein
MYFVLTSCIDANLDGHHDRFRDVSIFINVSVSPGSIRPKGELLYVDIMTLPVRDRTNSLG